MTDARKLRLLGILALVFCAAHMVEMVVRHDLPSFFWMCNITGPLLALGCLARRRALVSVSLLWIAWGTGLFGVDIATGGEFYATALLSHAGVLAIGVAAVRIIGWARGSWWKAAALQPAFLVLARLFTGPADNVNLAYAVWRGWEDVFPSHAVYLGVLLVGSTALYGALELAFRRIALPGAGAITCAG